MADKPAKIDWDPVERAYRAGVLSIREIGKLHDVSEAAIRKKAKGDPKKGHAPWQRDLTQQVRERVRSELVRSEVRTVAPEERMRTEREIVDNAAAVVVQVVREHRRSIASGRDLVALLMEQLSDVATNRQELEQIVEEETELEKTNQRRARLLKAISLSTHAGVIRDLATALKSLIPLERQAFNIGADIEDPTPEVQSDEDLDRAIAAFAAKAGLGIAAAGKG
jgi:hypothetical protein